MTLFQDEQIIQNIDREGVILTTHRVRQIKQSLSLSEKVSIMLEHVTSCEIRRNANPVWLIIAVILGVLLGYMAFTTSSHIPEGILLGYGVAILACLIAYMFSISYGLVISSPSAKIIVKNRGMKYDAIEAFIEELEYQKNKRLKLT